jgi:ComF family protein
MAEAMGILMSRFFYNRYPSKSFDLTVPVPMHPIRFIKRGFNQSALIARCLSKRLDIPISFDTLIKKRNTKPQSTLDKRERSENLKGSFAVKNNSRINDKRVLLVDDVITTSSTVNECSKTLIEAGARSVRVFSFCRSR